MTSSSAPTRSTVEDLYRRHAGEIHGYLYRRAGGAGADLLGEVFVVALQRMADLPEPDLRRAWLFGVARRLLMAADRKSSQRRRAENESSRFGDHADGPSTVSPSDRVQAVREALDSLREPDRELIRLTEWERLSIIEAASTLGLRAGTARVRLHRARRTLAAHPSLQGFAVPTAPPPPRAAT